MRNKARRGAKAKRKERERFIRQAIDCNDNITLTVCAPAPLKRETQEALVELGRTAAQMMRKENRC